MGKRNSTKILIIGGVAGGATAAARIRRLDENAEITILEKGPYVSFANCGLPYFISRDIQRRSKLLLQTPEGFFSRYRVTVKINTEALEIKRNEKKVVVKTQHGEELLPYDRLILAQGGSPIVPQLPGITLERVFKLWTIPDMDRIHKYIEEKKPAKAVIAGGGFIGLEMAEALSARGIEVTLIELAPQVMISMDPEFSSMIKAGLEEKGIIVKTSVGLSSISDTTVKLSDGSELETDMVLLSIGVRPELTLAKSAGLEIGSNGGLIVDENMRTSDPDIYAAGDMVEVSHKVHGKKVRIPLAGPANRQGRIAGTNAIGGNMRYRGALGTSVVKLFERTAASTGLSEKAAAEAGYETGVSYVFKDNHVTYFPGGKPLALKIVFDKKTGRLLGGQAYGEDGVEKRIDVLATALHGNMTLEDLSELDLAYAPPYNSANDPVNMAAFIGLNDIMGYSPLKTPAQVLPEQNGKESLILDVRTVGEQAKAPLLDTLHIPADELRDRLGEIPEDKTIYIMSKDGFLGHTSLQILKAAGYKKIFNIAGGYSAAKWFDGWNFNN
ncbi:MAG: FAD-dependent oxidoreductase [Ignavibacteria bacterium]|jgi:NADPH-dependent 2,4-dienoyl-CoA reductase/sulfur reductase-like enzyme/rhodanese-related sulfurtransferase|nr:FAD-dependent oxidoreductase [Ignavibacteria bacterium]MCU7503025.1 FAD-dependent oxidoreductase [Ignavibacteria bacterium]MCU7516555.1 FAD-dependent oxidoreductase [Ignavibacteria bacterium]